MPSVVSTTEVLQDLDDHHKYCRLIGENVTFIVVGG